MKLERLLPRKETVEKLGVPVDVIYNDLETLSLEELLSSPREYILQGNISTDILREIRKLGVEFSISGEKNQLVFSTGSVGNIEPSLEMFLLDENDQYPAVTKRYLESTYSMHSHDSVTGIVPSISDVDALKAGKNNRSLLFTNKGILSYTWDKNLDVIEKFESFLNYKYKNFDLQTLDNFFSLEHAEQIKILQDFYAAFDVISQEATWEEKERVQQIVDKYFEQE